MQQNKIGESCATGRFPSKLQSSYTQSHHNTQNIRQTQFSFGYGRRSILRQEQLTFGDQCTLRNSRFPLPPQIETYKQNRATISQRKIYQPIPVQSTILARSSPFDNNSPNSTSTIGTTFDDGPKAKSSYVYNSSDHNQIEEVKSGCWCWKN